MCHNVIFKGQTTIKHENLTKINQTHFPNPSKKRNPYRCSDISDKQASLVPKAVEKRASHSALLLLVTPKASQIFNIGGFCTKREPPFGSEGD